ncbi:MAG: hypothetical protein ACTSWF_04205 [Candidatus Freyarchaeota archaeon]
MRPPICAICDKRFLDSEEGGLVYFKKRPSDYEWIKKMEEKGMVGHPPLRGVVLRRALPQSQRTGTPNHRRSNEKAKKPKVKTRNQAITSLFHPLI